MDTRFLSSAIAGIAAVSTAAIVAPAPAQAANIVASYNVEAYKPGSHAFWMNDLANRGYATNKDFVFETPGMFTIFEDEAGDFTATLMGRIVNEKDSNEYFDVDIDFFGVDAPASLKGQNKAPGSNGAEKTAWAKENWQFFDFVSGEATLSADGGRYAGSTIEFIQMDSKKAVQFGTHGANDKNKKLGLSTWFKADKSLSTLVVDGDAKTDYNFKGDINVILEPKPVPEPTGVLGISAVAVGLAGLKRKQRNAK
ncbi:MAG: PEP-CTERM sorting domain-containing protein [Cyanobacteria bacterium P01_C01_bin.89]